MLYMLEAVEQTARDTRDRILKIRALMEEVRLRVQEEAPGIYSKDLVESIFENPYCRIAFIEKAGIAKRQTASIYLKKMEEMGILEGFKLGREIYYVNRPLLGLLTD